MASSRPALDERFPGDALDLDVWFPHYLPHWSSRAASRATHVVRDGELRLSIPADQPLWCADRHAEPLRVSCVQSGALDGQQPFADGLTVTEAQPEFWGYTPRYGRVEVRMRAVITARSMAAFWMSGIEDVPEHSGELCVMEVFGDAVRAGSADVGIGVHRFRDPDLREDFAAHPLPIDVAEFHTYAVDWRPGESVFSVDGVVVRRIGQAPDYPMQLMLGVFDFPAKAGNDRDGPAEGGDPHVPELVVRHVRGEPLTPP
jgi:hypothetical protein